MTDGEKTCGTTDRSIRSVSRKKAVSPREIPVRHDLEVLLLEYLKAADLKEGPLFRTTSGKTKLLTCTQVTGIDICRMMKRRLREAGLPTHFSPHSFRVATVTDLLEQNQPLEDVQQLAGHADPRTTRLYDRQEKEGNAKYRGAAYLMPRTRVGIWDQSFLRFS